MNSKSQILQERGVIMKRNITKALALAMTLCTLAAPVTAQAANKDFKFSFSNTTSKESSLGGAYKSNDGDTNAYARGTATGSNLAIKGAKVNVRVRDNAGNYATEYRTITSYNVRYTLPYLQGKAVGGAYYRLYGNVETTQGYPVNLSGVWCP